MTKTTKIVLVAAAIGGAYLYLQKPSAPSSSAGGAVATFTSWLKGLVGAGTNKAQSAMTSVDNFLSGLGVQIVDTTTQPYSATDGTAASAHALAGQPISDASASPTVPTVDDDTNVTEYA